MPRVNKAVLDALQKRDIEELRKDMQATNNAIVEGFKGVHLRQDTTNGKVLKNTEEIAKIKEWRNFEKLTWFLLTTLVGVVVYFITKS